MLYTMQLLEIQSHCGDDCKGSSGLSKASSQRGQDSWFFPTCLWFGVLACERSFCNILSDTSGRRLLFWPRRARNIRLFDEYGGAAKLIRMIKEDFFFFFFACLVSELCSNISSRDATLQPSIPAGLGKVKSLR